jgi:hypothetical protein
VYLDVELNANQRLPHGDVAISRIHQWIHGKGGF